MKLGYQELCKTKQEETLRDRVHIVSHTCAFGPSLKSHLEGIRNRFRNTRSAIFCVPGESENRDEG